MKRLNKIATVVCSAVLGLMALTSCEGGDLYKVNSPDWLASRIDSIANANSGDEGPLYTFGQTDYSSGWWADFSKYYVIPQGQMWEATFDLHINPSAPNTYKNFVLILTNDAERGGRGYKEYGAIRFDTQPSGNSEWGDYINRDLVVSNLVFKTDTDPGIDRLGGMVTLTVDRAGGGLAVKMTNGGVTKTYIDPSELPNLNSDETNTNIRCFLVVEGSYIDFWTTNIDAFDENAEHQPLAMELSGVPSEVLLGTTLEEAMSNVTAYVSFEDGVSKTVSADQLVFEAIPDMNELGQKTLVAVYNKTFRGENCAKPVVAIKTFSVVNELSAFTQTVVVPNPIVLGAEDNTQAWWTVHTENIKVEPKETKVVNFTNYTCGENNWNNFVIVLNAADVTKEYAVVRADNWGWGDGYGACTTVGGFSTDDEWATWLAAMNGAKVTAYITNNGDGSADVKAVMHGTDGVEYVQEYNGINTINPDDFYFRFTVDASHIVFDNELGAADCSTGWWTAFTPNVQVKAHQVCTVNFTNYTSGAENWNNFVVILNKDDLTEYAVVRADNWGWGDGYGACTSVGGFSTAEEWATWLAAMNGAKVSLQIVNNGDGTADVKAVMHGTDGVDYIQDYIGINTIDPDNFYFRFTVDSSYLVFE
jgi:hypothetical protein